MLAEAANAAIIRPVTNRNMMGFYMKRFLTVLILLVTCSVVLHAQAQDQDQKIKKSNTQLAQRTRIAKQSATMTGDRGSFTVSSSETLNKHQYSFGMGWSNFDRTPKDIDVNSFPVYASYGVFNGLTVSAMVESH